MVYLMSPRATIDKILLNSPEDKVQYEEWSTVQDAVESFVQHVHDSAVCILQGYGQIRIVITPHDLMYMEVYHEH